MRVSPTLRFRRFTTIGFLVYVCYSPHTRLANECKYLVAAVIVLSFQQVERSFAVTKAVGILLFIYLFIMFITPSRPKHYSRGVKYIQEKIC